MGIEFLLVKDAERETYDLGKFTGNWARLLAEPGTDLDRVEAGDPFTVDQDVDRVAAKLEEDWATMESDWDGYLRLVAEDVIRWAGSSLVRSSCDASHDGWYNRDGSWDEGSQTGSRYPEDHPEWVRPPRSTKEGTQT